MPYGTMLADTFQSSAANTAPTIYDGNSREIGQFCKGWMSIAGSAGTVKASFNYSTMTKSATGTWILNFTVCQSDGNYSVGGMTYQSTVLCPRINAANSSSMTVMIYNTGAALADGDPYVSVFR